MMECNDCLFEGWNEQTTTTHIERWPDKSEVEAHIVQAGNIMISQKVTKCWVTLGTVTIAFVQPVTG